MPSCQPCHLAPSPAPPRCRAESAASRPPLLEQWDKSNQKINILFKPYHRDLPCEPAASSPPAPALRLCCLLPPPKWTPGLLVVRCHAVHAPVGCLVAACAPPTHAQVTAAAGPSKVAVSALSSFHHAFPYHHPLCSFPPDHDDHQTLVGRVEAPLSQLSTFLFVAMVSNPPFHQMTTRPWWRTWWTPPTCPSATTASKATGMLRQAQGCKGWGARALRMHGRERGGSKRRGNSSSLGGSCLGSPNGGARLPPCCCCCPLRAAGPRSSMGSLRCDGWTRTTPSWSGLLRSLTRWVHAMLYPACSGPCPHSATLR